MLYKSFSLSGNPFEGEAAVEPAYLVESVQTLRADLVEAVLAGTGLAAVTGPRGSGKTTLLDRVASDLADRVPHAVIVRESCRTHCSAAALVRQVCNHMQVALPAAADAPKRDGVALTGGPIVLVIDDAHRLGGVELRQFLHGLDPDRLSALGLLILCAGEPQLRRHLVAALPRELRRRIMVLRRLAPMSEGEIAQFIGHRLERRGGQRTIFGADAIGCVAQRSGGVPERVNELCSAALYSAFLGGETRITARHVERAASLRSPPAAGPAPAPKVATARTAVRPGKPAAGDRPAATAPDLMKLRPTFGIAAGTKPLPGGKTDAVAGSIPASPAAAAEPRRAPARGGMRRPVAGPKPGRRGYAALAASVAVAVSVGVGHGLIDRLGDGRGDGAEADATASVAPEPPDPDMQAGQIAERGGMGGLTADGDGDTPSFDVELAKRPDSGFDILEPVFPEPAERPWPAAYDTGDDTGAGIVSLASASDLPTSVEPASPTPPTLEAIEPSQRPIPPLRSAWQVSVRPIPPRKPRSPAQTAAADPAPPDCWWQQSGVPADPKACLEALRRLTAEGEGIDGASSALAATAPLHRGSGSNDPGSTD